MVVLMMPFFCYKVHLDAFSDTVNIIFGMLRLQYLAVLRIRDAYPGSEFFHPRSRVKKIPDPGSEFFPSRIRIFSHPGSGSWGQKKHRIPDPQHI
jgi:hypothetical protein